MTNTNKPVPDRIFDLEDAGCGDLAAGLQRYFRELPGGVIVRVVAQDPGARYDIPAWCRMTGHALRYEEPPEYFIESRRR